MSHIILFQECERESFNLKRMVKKDDSFWQQLLHVHPLIDKMEGVYHKDKKLFVSDEGKEYQVYPDGSVKLKNNELNQTKEMPTESIVLIVDSDENTDEYHPNGEMVNKRIEVLATQLKELEEQGNQVILCVNKNGLINKSEDLFKEKTPQIWNDREQIKKGDFMTVRLFEKLKNKTVLIGGIWLEKTLFETVNHFRDYRLSPILSVNPHLSLEMGLLKPNIAEGYEYYHTLEGICELRNKKLVTFH